MFKRRRMVLLLFLAVFGAANIGNLLRDPVYRASAKVMLTNERAYPEVSPLPRPASVDRPPNETVINSEIQLIRSRDLLRQVHFEIAAQREESGDDRPVPSVQSMENRLSVLRKPSSQVLEIGYRSSQPDEAIEIVNTVVNRYVRYAIEKHNEPEALEFFTKQTEEALSLYQESDVALERYDASHGLTSIAIEKDQMLRQRAQLEADLRRTEADIIEVATRVASVEAELEYIPEHEATEVDMIPNPMLAYLRQNLARLEMEHTKLLGLYTPQHRLVQDIEGEISALKQQVVAQETSIIGRKRMSTTSVRRSLEQSLLEQQSELGAMEARRAMLSERIGDYDARIRVMHSKHYQVMRLRRDRMEKKSSYDALVEKLSQLRVSHAMDKAGLGNVTIVEAAAAPLKREPDFKGITFVLAMFAGLLIGVGSAIVTEMLNPVMNSDVDVRHHLGLPVLAEIPLNAVENGHGNGNGNGNGNGGGNGNGNGGGNGNGHKHGNGNGNGNGRVKVGTVSAKAKLA
jgi:uncharacterized protein involved in exopolysaccharide biosynthesis